MTGTGNERSGGILRNREGDRSKRLSAIKGSLVGGAAGDALGYAVEFTSLSGILKRYGENGIQRYENDMRTGLAIISDDTQMSLFTANGLLVWDTVKKMQGEADVPERYIYMAYRDWYMCQNGMDSKKHESISWLCDVPAMHALRAPGNTCLSALRQQGFGTIEEPVNHSKGCGGVMRVAPIPLFFGKAETREELEKICLLAAQASALTHGHPLGYMPSAALAQIISRAAFGGCPYEGGLSGILRECIEVTEDMFAGDAYLPKLIGLMKQAETLAGNDLPDTENIAALGEGWVAEETLAIALYCCLRYPDDFSKAIIASVNHSGDSDSTGAVTGNILGAYLGYEKIDFMWLGDLEIRDVIEEIAKDLCDGCPADAQGGCESAWLHKYGEAGLSAH